MKCFIIHKYNMYIFIFEIFQFNTDYYYLHYIEILYVFYKE